MAAISLDDCLQNATQQLLTYLDSVAHNGDRVLQLRSKLSSDGAAALLRLVVAAQGTGPLSEQAERAMRYFDVNPNLQYNEKRTARGECIRLCALLTRLDREMHTPATAAAAAAER
jgi:hypothetical protein